VLQKEMERKKQRRRLKNREAAHVSRERKKAYIKGIEEEVKTLRVENADLKAKLAQLEHLLQQQRQSNSRRASTPCSPVPSQATDSSFTHGSPVDYVSEFALPTCSPSDNVVDQDDDTDMLSNPASPSDSSQASISPPPLDVNAFVNARDLGLVKTTDFAPMHKPIVQTDLIDAELFGLRKVPGSAVLRDSAAVAHSQQSKYSSSKVLSPHQLPFLSFLVCAMMVTSLCSNVPTYPLSPKVLTFTQPTLPLAWTSTMDLIPLSRQTSNPTSQPPMSFSSTSLLPPSIRVL